MPQLTQRGSSWEGKEEGQADPFTGRALTALPGKRGQHKSWGIPQIHGYPAKAWTRQQAPLQEDGPGSSGSARQAGLVQTSQPKSSLPSLFCSMAAVALLATVLGLLRPCQAALAPLPAQAVPCDLGEGFLLLLIMGNEDLTRS